mmetsp:Transcript_13023/g.46309  ORF Transcript_13023/g.46309 Transcript_13023/m.46309 type:complete len:323 (+) Transcript_13023:198-1166(+)
MGPRDLHEIPMRFPWAALATTSDERPAHIQRLEQACAQRTSLPSDPSSVSACTFKGNAPGSPQSEANWRNRLPQRFQLRQPVGQRALPAGRGGPLMLPRRRRGGERGRSAPVSADDLRPLHDRRVRLREVLLGALTLALGEAEVRGPRRGHGRVREGLGDVELLLEVDEAVCLRGKVLQLLPLLRLRHHLLALQGELQARLPAHAGDLEVQGSILLLEDVALGRQRKQPGPLLLARKLNEKWCYCRLIRLRPRSKGCRNANDDWDTTGTSHGLLKAASLDACAPAEHDRVRRRLRRYHRACTREAPRAASGRERDVVGRARL